MINFTIIKKKMAQNATILLSTAMAYKARSYSTTTKLYGDVVIDNKKNTYETKILLQDLSDSLINRDKSQVYCNLIVSVTNQNDYMSSHNMDLINKMLRAYNSEFDLGSPKRISAEECMYSLSIPFSSETLCTNNITPYLNLNETLAMEYINRSGLGFYLYKNTDNNLKIPNLGIQPNNDCIGIMHKHPVTGETLLYYIDIKNTTYAQVMSKLQLTNALGKSMFLIQGSGQRFGCNIYIIATSEKKDFVLSMNERAEMITYLQKMHYKYPNIYQGLQESKGYTNFLDTGSLKELNTCGYPVPIFVNPKDLVPAEIIDKLKETSEYKRLLVKMTNEEFNTKYGISLIDENDS